MDKASERVINGYGGSRRSTTTFGATHVITPSQARDRLLAGANLSGSDAGMEGIMSGSRHVAVNEFERPRTAPGLRTRDIEVRAGPIQPRATTTPRRNPAMLAAGKQRRPAAPKRGQVKAAIAHSVLQTLSAIVQGARDVALRRSFSWHN